MNEVDYKINEPLDPKAVVELYRSAGLPRPVDDEARIAKMLENSDLVISAWHDGELIGVSRTITDWVWCSYLADLAVRTDFQKAGIGRKLVELTRAHVTEQSMVLLLSVPDAMEYYPKIGMEKLDNAFILWRER